MANPNQPRFPAGMVGGAGGRFARLVELPSPRTKKKSISLGGLTITQNMIGVDETAKALKGARTRAGGAILNDADRRAAQIQARLRAAVLATYTKSDTGRMSRGIFATAQKQGTADGKIETIIRISMTNYREANYLTNIGGSGYFKRFPVEAYTIFAKGIHKEERVGFIKSKRSSAHFAAKDSVGRLKVPRRGAFFVAQRGRGGGESRVIHDVLGPASAGDNPSSFFFYPLWVNHPGFPVDIISQVAANEGARFQEEIVDSVGATIQSGRQLTVSTVIPHTGVERTGAGIRTRPTSVYRVPAQNTKQTSRSIR